MSTKKLEIAGQKFNRWQVIKEVSVRNRLGSFWLCECECGKQKILAGYSLTGNHTKSCGCWRVEVSSRAQKIYSTPEEIYLSRLFKSIKYRCFVKGNKSYKNYGGRGITVFSEWVLDRKKFIKYILDNIGFKPSDKYSLDRINNDGNYEPGNLRWADRHTQNMNKRPSIISKHSGVKPIWIERV